MAEVLTSQAVDFPSWYQDVVAKAHLAEPGPVRGTQVIRPVGYAIWERLVAEMDARIKAAGAQNVAFPLLIPQSYLDREAEHVEGFAPELAVVTHGGGKQLDEPVVIRPTSETVFGEYMGKWVNSYRDLPLLLNQWCNVMRWELRTRLFLRSSEFLWQEGHTAHATESEARAYARRILHEVYEDFLVNVAAIPVTVGLKTTRERFAGAVATYTLEAMMRDGKALQMGTSHELGRNFARSFNIDFLSADGRQELCWTTSWGSSTRIIGGLIMCHGDDHGLRVPPRLAPIQAHVMIVKAGDGVGDVAGQLRDELRRAGVRVGYDERVDIPFGRRAIDAELRGYPVRLEIGPHDVAAGTVTMVRRVDGSKTPTPLADTVAAVLAALDADQRALYAEADNYRRSHTHDVATLDDAIAATGDGFARVPWAAVGPAGEAKANAVGVTVRCLTRADGTVPDSSDDNGLIAHLARSY